MLTVNVRFVADKTSSDPHSSSFCQSDADPADLGDTLEKIFPWDLQEKGVFHGITMSLHSLLYVKYVLLYVV